MSKKIANVIIMNSMIIKLLLLTSILFALVPCVAEGKIIAISRGPQEMLALDDQGHVWIWGNGTPPSNAQKVFIDNVTAISAGGSNYALKNDCTVWAWGYGGNGLLGDGGTENHYTPVQVSGLTDIVAIAAGSQNGFALKKDGSVWGWGLNNVGQLGIGAIGIPKYATTPVHVEGLTDIVSIGENGGYAVKSDGTVYTWINDTIEYPNGQLTISQIPNISNVKQISHSYGVHYNVLLKNDGTVWVWGDNQFGEVGNGSVTYYYQGKVWPPVQAAIINVKRIATGYWGVIDALKEDGTVWEWGMSQLGDPDTNINFGTVYPRQISGLDNVVQICPGGALKDDGTVWGWGQNSDKWLKDDDVSTIVKSPIKIFEDPVESKTMPSLSPTSTILPTVIVSPSNARASISPYPSVLASSGTPLASQASGFDFKAILATTGLILVGSLAYSRMKK